MGRTPFRRSGNRPFRRSRRRRSGRDRPVWLGNVLRRAIPFARRTMFLGRDRAGVWSLLVVSSVLMSGGGCARSTDAPTSEVDSQDGAHGSPIAATPDIAVRTVGWESSPLKPRVQERDWDYVVIHHTATVSGSVESIHRIHRRRQDAAGNPWRGIGYHFVIGNGQGMEDGAIEPTFRWREQLAGAHAGVRNYNERGIGVCLVGNFEKHPPTRAQLASLNRLITLLIREFGIPAGQVVRHGDIKSTNCPGKLFPMQDFVREPSSSEHPEAQGHRSDR